jgi:two-component sensor histidine kinase
MEERIGFYQRASDLYAQNTNKLGVIGSLVGIANVQILNRKYDEAEKNLQQSLAQYKAIGHKELQYTYDLLQSLEYVRGNYTRSVVYNLEAIKYMKASGDTTRATHYYYFLAKSYFTAQKYKEALVWARKVAASKDANADIKTVLVQTLLQLNMTKEAGTALNKLLTTKTNLTFSDTLSQYRVAALYYEKVNKNDMAIQYYKKILNLDFNKDYSQDIIYTWFLVCNIDLARLYIRSNQAEKALKYIENTATQLKNAKTPVEPGYWLRHYDNLYQYNIARDNYREALKGLALRDHIKDSLYTAAKDKQVSELNIKYETVQKEQSIKDLHSQGAVQQARLDKANLQRNITIAGVVLLLIIAGAAYKGYLDKQRSNLQLQAKQQQINAQNTTLQHLLTEKDWLLKEVHHRVKNNLHTVICLLESQARHLENDALEAIEKSQHRIYAMSLIHQKLYQSDDVKAIDMAEYIPELVRSLEDSFGSSNQIQFSLDIDPVDLTLSQAIPLGLILNEAVTNSIKYAFPEGRNGEISISMMEHHDLITLKIADNGIGMPLIDLDTEPESMGLRLMKGLSEDIDADISFETEKGTSITILFKRDALADVEGFLALTEQKQEPV